MNWQDKIYESLTETRSAENRRKVRLRKTSAEQERRKARGRSVGAYGAGTRAREPLAIAKKASKTTRGFKDAGHTKRHFQREGDKLIAHGKRYAAKQKAKNKDNKSRTDLVNKVLKRDETQANLAKLTIRGK